jgi:DnaJ-domain-containing protein 1
MSGVTAALVVGIGLALTLLVGIASQFVGRVAREPAHRQPIPDPPHYGPTHEQQEDIDAINKSIEEARAELLWLRDQVARERANLERLRRQAPRAAPNGGPAGAQPGAGPARGTGQGPGMGTGLGARPEQAALAPDSPWVVLGLRPGASPEDVRRRYRLLSRVWHPDRFADGPAELRAEAEMMMARLNRAHNALSGQAATARRSY